MSLVLLSSAEMRRAESFAAAALPPLTLMENAGRCVADAAVAVLGAKPRVSLAGSVVAVLCGPGNNGGDGFIAARLLREAGASVRVGLLGPL